MTTSVPVFSIEIRIATSRSVPTTSRESSIPVTETLRNFSGRANERSRSRGFARSGKPSQASPRLAHEVVLSNCQPIRCKSVNTTRSLLLPLPSARESVATPRASCARNAPPTGSSWSKTSKTSARWVSGVPVFSSGAGPPRTIEKAVPFGAPFTKSRASSTARSNVVLPFSSNNIEVDPSITIATSRRSLV